MNQELKNIQQNLMFDKTNWEKVKFGNVAIQKKKNVDRETTELTKYIKGEHMNSEDLHIREWGDLKDEYLGPAFHRLFEKGDILYGSRRTYLRKVAIAEFDGITSNTTFTINPNEEAIIPNLLPFIMLSEGFSQHSIKNSKGSVNPYINWKDIASYEFLLPPIDQQAKIAELLWAMDDVVEKENKVLQNIKIMKRSAANKLLLGKNISEEKRKSIYGEIPLEWDLVNIYELRDKRDNYSFTGGPFGSNLKSIHYTDSGVRIIQLQNIGEGEFLGDYKLFTSEKKADQLNSCNIFPGEIILAKMAPVARCCIVPNNDKRYVMCSDGIRLKVDEIRFSKKFIYHSLNSSHFMAYAETKSTGSTRARIGLNDLKKIPVPIPNRYELQNEIAFILDIIDNSYSSILAKMNNSKQLQKSLINEIFSS